VLFRSANDTLTVTNLKVKDGKRTPASINAVFIAELAAGSRTILSIITKYDEDSGEVLPTSSVGGPVILNIDGRPYKYSPFTFPTWLTTSGLSWTNPLLDQTNTYLGPR
jgi:hypothetical protein